MSAPTTAGARHPARLCCAAVRATFGDWWGERHIVLWRCRDGVVVDNGFAFHVISYSIKVRVASAQSRSASADT